MSREIRVLIASAERALRLRVRSALAPDPEVLLVGIALDAIQLLDQPLALQPDILLLDEALVPHGAGSLLTALAIRLPRLRVLLCCRGLDSPRVIEAVELGSQGCLAKDAEPEEWRRAIRVVHEGDVWLPRRLLVKAMADLLYQAARGTRTIDDRMEQLTDRQRDIVRAVANGLSNKEIARRLGISPATVKTHLHNVFERLGVHGRLRLLASAEEQEGA